VHPVQVETHSTDIRRELHYLLGWKTASVGSTASERVTTERTLYVLETPDTTDTVTDTCKTTTFTSDGRDDLRVVVVIAGQGGWRHQVDRGEDVQMSVRGIVRLRRHLEEQRCY